MPPQAHARPASRRPRLATSTHRTLLPLAALAAIAAASGAAAQPVTRPGQSVPPPLQAVSEAPWPAVTIDEALAQNTDAPATLAAHLLERIALLDLRLQAAPTVEDFRLAAIGLEAAALRHDDDPNTWRRVAEAAFNAGDEAVLERATRRIVALDPADTVAQLRLISTRISRLQTGSERLAAYGRLLGSGGAALDPSVRSRLALDAALLARETGDADEFARLLTLATQLDSSHKEAAALALAYYQASLPDDPLGRMQLLCNLLLADPLDPHVHLAISSELSAHGAFDQAARFHNNARNIVGASDAALAEQLDIRGLILTWQLSGPESVVEILTNRLANARHDAAYNVALKEARGMAVRAEERPQNVRLPREYELILLLSADASGYRDVATASASDLTASAMEVVEFYQRPENQLTGQEGRRLAERITEMWMETLVVRAWSSGNMDALAADLQRTLDEMGSVVDLSEPMAWYGLRTGQQDKVIEFFRSTQDERYRSRLGLAMALEAQGLRSDASEVYARIAREDPTSVQSAWARSRLLFMTGEDLARTRFADQVAAVAATVPVAIDRMLLDPSEFMRLAISSPSTRVGPLDSVEVTLTLANRASMPLSVGSDRPIDSRFLLSPAARVGSTSIIGSVQPEVIDLDRRLRLRPGEQVSTRLWLDCGFTGAFMESQAASRTAVRWRAIQGFRIVDQAYVRGPLCLSNGTPEVYREPLLFARLEYPELVRAVREAPEDRLPALARAVWGACLSGSYGRRLTPEQVASLGSAMSERYLAAGTQSRTTLLLALPHGTMADGFATFDDGVRQSIAAETDPTLLLAALLTRAITPDDPIIGACRASPEAWLSVAAQIHADRLARPDLPVYSNAGPGIAGLLGPSLPSLRGVVE